MKRISKKQSRIQLVYWSRFVPTSSRELIVKVVGCVWGAWPAQSVEHVSSSLPLGIELATGHCGSVYTIIMGKHWKWGLLFLFLLLSFLLFLPPPPPSFLPAPRAGCQTFPSFPLAVPLTEPCLRLGLLLSFSNRKSPEISSIVYVSLTQRISVTVNPNRNPPLSATFSVTKAHINEDFAKDQELC